MCSTFSILKTFFYGFGGGYNHHSIIAVKETMSFHENTIIPVQGFKKKLRDITTWSQTPSIH